MTRLRQCERQYDRRIIQCALPGALDEPASYRTVYAPYNEPYPGSHDSTLHPLMEVQNYLVLDGSITAIVAHWGHFPGPKDHVSFGGHVAYFNQFDTTPEDVHDGPNIALFPILENGQLASSLEDCTALETPPRPPAPPMTPPPPMNPFDTSHSLQSPEPTPPPAPPLPPPPPSPPYHLNLTVGGMSIQKVDASPNATDDDYLVEKWQYEVEVFEDTKTRIFFEPGYLYDAKDWVVFVPMCAWVA